MGTPWREWSREDKAEIKKAAKILIRIDAKHSNDPIPKSHRKKAVYDALRERLPIRSRALLILMVNKERQRQESKGDQTSL